MSAAIIVLTGLYENTDEVSAPSQRALNWLIKQGVSAAAMSSPWAVHTSRIVFDGCGRYHANRLGVFSYILPAIAVGEIVDLVAWAPATGQVASRLGVASYLGEIGRGDGGTGLSITVHRSPLSWLRAGRTGTVIIDFDAAAAPLSGLALQAEDQPHARELRQRLRLPPPVIVVPEVARRRAA